MIWPAKSYFTNWNYRCSDRTEDPTEFGIAFSLTHSTYSELPFGILRLVNALCHLEKTRNCPYQFLQLYASLSSALWGQ